MSFNLTFGNIITIIVLVAGMIAQYYKLAGRIDVISAMFKDFKDRVDDDINGLGKRINELEKSIHDLEIELTKKAVKGGIADEA